MSETEKTPTTVPPPASPVPPAARPLKWGEAETKDETALTEAVSENSGDTVRRIRLTVSRIDPWSVMKLSFLLSIALGIVLVVAVGLVWVVLNQMQVFSSIHAIVDDIGAQRQFGQILEYLEFSRVLSAATVIAVVDIVLITALSTLGAFIYNFVAALVGGLHLTLTDD